MLRCLSLAVALWVVLAPAFCLAGVFVHACDDCGEGACTHEERCADDPCAEGDRPAAPPAGVTRLGPLLSSVPDLPRLASPAPVALPASAPPPALAGPPFPPSDLPLLI